MEHPGGVVAHLVAVGDSWGDVSGGGEELGSLVSDGGRSVGKPDERSGTSRATSSSGHRSLSRRVHVVSGT